VQMRAQPAIFRLIAISTVVGLAPTAHAACLPSEITSVSYTSTSLSPYNPFTNSISKLVTVQVSATHACAVELAFFSPTVPPRMSGSGLLGYDVRAQNGAASLVFGGGAPLSTVTVDIGIGNVGAALVQISVPAGQVVSDGLYSDAGLIAQVFDRSGSIFTLLKSSVMPVSGSVAKVCQFSAPSTPTLNFTAAISNGIPDPAYVRSLTFDSVNCTAPSTVRLSGSAMQPTQPSGAPPGLDNRIHYRASASFNAASAVLDTRTTNDVSSTARNTITGATVNGSMGLDVNLLAGKPLIAGTYTATLTVSIDPNP
jgi:hypothetical protein